MIYLDYAANTPVDEEVLKVFCETSIDYIANPNSPHNLGLLANKRFNESQANIAKLLGAKENEIIFTSGATESNNMAIKGIAHSYKRYGKHIITTYLEHASVTGPIVALQNEGFEVDFVTITENGEVDLEHLKELLRDDTILVSICYVDSEIGLKQPIEQISELLKDRKHCFFHVDATQAVGKIAVAFTDIDLLTCSGHKIYGPTGCGILVKKEALMLEPLIHGGISTTTFRSGTPMLSMVAATEKALSLAINELEKNLKHVTELNHYLREKLGSFKNVVINSKESGSPYILNISMKGLNTNQLQQHLSDREIYVATKSACCAPNTVSRPVYAMTKDRKLALNTLRISFSHKTTMEELNIFVEKFHECLKLMGNK